MASKPNYEYINNYSAQNYDRITILVPKGSKKAIVEAAEAAGKSTSEYIVERLPKRLIGPWKSELMRKA